MVIHFLVPIQHDIIIKVGAHIVHLCLALFRREGPGGVPLQRPGQTVGVLGAERGAVVGGHRGVLRDVAHEALHPQRQRLQQRKRKALGVAGQHEQGAVAV